MKTKLPLSLIAALAENRVIGVDNRMPWHLPADFKYFKATTLGKPIIMGRKTWDSLGRPLPGRLNLVVSRQAGLQLDGAEVFPSLDAALVRAEEWALEQGVDELMLIGGAQLYAQGLEQADRLYSGRRRLVPGIRPERVAAGFRRAASGGRRQAGVQFRGLGKNLTGRLNAGAGFAAAWQPRAAVAASRQPRSPQQLIRPAPAPYAHRPPADACRSVA